MNDKDLEALSAMMDGEAQEHEVRRLLREADRTPELSARWERQHLASAILRRQTGACRPVDLARIDLAERVAAAIDAPAPARAPVWLRYRGLASAAIAASVAMVVVAGWEWARPAPVAAEAGLARTLAANPAPLSRGALRGATRPDGRSMVQVVDYVPRQSRFNVDAVREQALVDEHLAHYLHSRGATVEASPYPRIRAVSVKPASPYQQ